MKSTLELVYCWKYFANNCLQTSGWTCRWLSLTDMLPLYTFDLLVNSVLFGTERPQHQLFSTDITLRRWPRSILIAITVYTDGSLIDGSSGCAFVSDDHIFTFGLHNLSSVYAAELYTIRWVLLYISHQIRISFLVCSESLSAIKSAIVPTPDHPIASQMLWQLSHFFEKECCIVFCWVSISMEWGRCHWCQRGSYSTGVCPGPSNRPLRNLLSGNASELYSETWRE
jgi:hypothetical protein